MQDAKNKSIEHILILSGDHLYRMDYMDFVQVKTTFLWNVSSSIGLHFLEILLIDVNVFAEAY